MTVRQAEATWEGKIKDGRGTVQLGSGAFEGPFSFSSRFEDQPGTNPEELIGAAHAGCFSMALSKQLTDAGHPPNRIETSAKVHLEQMQSGFAISRIELHTAADVPGLTPDRFKELASQAKVGCPVSKALGGVLIDLTAALKGE